MSNLNHKLISENVNGVIKFNQKDWSKPYIDLNTETPRIQKVILIIFFELMINQAFSKAIESVRKQRIIKLENNDKSRKCLVPITNRFSTK